MLEVAFLVSHILGMTTRPEMEVLYDLITKNAARAMGLERFTLEIDSNANLVVLDQPNVLEA